jgi:myo-inositol-1(or 4)-monophosphatase
VRPAAAGRLARRVQRVRMPGSAAIDRAWLAHGRTDAAVIFGNKPWDTAAGVILVREAGGLVVDSSGDNHTVRSASTVAASVELLGSLIDLILGLRRSPTPPQERRRQHHCHRQPGPGWLAA